MVTGDTGWSEPMTSFSTQLLHKKNEEEKEEGTEGEEAEKGEMEG